VRARVKETRGKGAGGRKKTDHLVQNWKGKGKQATHQAARPKPDLRANTRKKAKKKRKEGGRSRPADFH